MNYFHLGVSDLWFKVVLVTDLALVFRFRCPIKESVSVWKHWNANQVRTWKLHWNCHSLLCKSHNVHLTCTINKSDPNLNRKNGLVNHNMAGLTNSYISSTGSRLDEIDFEFLGNVSGHPYIIRTDIYTRKWKQRTAILPLVRSNCWFP